jgi:quercetin dioxygenase-like cupin family protein
MMERRSIRGNASLSKSDTTPQEATMSTKHEDGQGGNITILEHGSTTAPMRFRIIAAKDGARAPAPDCHPSQTEDFTVLRGTLDLGVIDGKQILLKAGETFHVPAGVYHLAANGGDDEMELEAVLTPGLESGDMFTDLYAVMREHRGLAQFARVSVVLRRYTSSIQFKTPVRAVMIVAAALARLFGVRALPAGIASSATSPDFTRTSTSTPTSARRQRHCGRHSARISP